MDFVYINEQIQQFRAGGNSIARFGFADANGRITRKSDTVCYASARSINRGEKYFFLAWNGEPANIPTNRFKEKTYGTDRNDPSNSRSSFIPGPLSDAWLDFLLSPEFSPWSDILEHLVTVDPVIIRESGIIIKNPGDIDQRLYYNFIIATRYAYEFSHRVVFWHELVKDHGLDPRAAFLISIGFTKVEDNVKPPLRKVLKREAGYRKDAGGYRYIRDEWGDKKWFPEEYDEVDDHPDWKPGTGWSGELRALTGCNHTPLGTINKYCGRVLNSNPGDERNMYDYAWDRFYTKDEPEFKGKATLENVLAFFYKLQKGL